MIMRCEIKGKEDCVRDVEKRYPRNMPAWRRHEGSMKEHVRISDKDDDDDDDFETVFSWRTVMRWLLFLQENQKEEDEEREERRPTLFPY